MNETIAVLMSTYNGSDYILEQLDSIVNQELVSIKLFIRDDGSEDDTYAKINNFKDQHPESEIYISQGGNIGYVKSFYILTKYVFEELPEIEYYAFSDQDDVWLPDKLYTALKCIDKNVSYPMLYCSNTMMTDHKLNKIGYFRKRQPKISPHTSLIQNIVTGCTTLFNRKAAELFVKHQIPEISVHDQYLYILCTLFGETIYDDSPHILYRQHSNNQIGKPRIFNRLSSSLRKLFTKSHSLEKRAQLIYSEFKNDLNGNALEAVKKIAFYRKSIKSRLSLFFDSNFRYDSKLSNFIFRLKILIGRV